MSSPEIPNLRNEIDSILLDLTSVARSSPEISWWLREETRAESEQRGIVDPKRGQHWVVEFRLGSSGTAAAIDMSAPQPVRDYFLADAAQDVVNEETLQSRPLCPYHNHQLILKTSQAPPGQLAWQCPSDPSIGCLVGKYWELAIVDDPGVGGGQRPS